MKIRRIRVADVKQAVVRVARGSGVRLEPKLPARLRATVHAAAAAAFVWPLARLDSVLGAAFGALVGSTIGPRMAASKWRTAVITIAALAGALGAAVVRHVVVDMGLFAPSFGAATTLRIGDSLFFFVLSASLIGLLRAWSARRRSFAVFEALFVSVAFAQLVVAHRHGSINRPFELADPILAAGGDPTQIFVGLGAAAAALIVLLLLNERSLLRSLLHLGVVFLVLLGVTLGTSILGMPAPPPAQMGLGLRPEKPNPDGNGESQQGQRRHSDDELEFKDDLQSEQQRVPVAVVLLHDDYSPPNGTYYLRQGAFSQYNGRRLVAASERGRDDDIVSMFPVGPTPVPDAPEAGQHRALVETTVALLAEHTKPFGLESPIEMLPAPNPDPDRFVRVYKVTSAVTTADAVAMLPASAGNPGWTAEEWAHYTTVPDDPRYAELATRILSELPPEAQTVPVQQLHRITYWLGEQGTYSHRNNHSRAEDPTAHFLFGDRTGYCVHFAHAATYLMRSAGLPARVATGYALDEAARRGGSAMLVTGEMSHAWPEVYLQGLGWVVADVAPQTVASPPPPPPDPDLQRLLGELARGLKPVPRDPEMEVAIVNAGQWAKTIGYATLVSFVFVLLVLYGVKLWRFVSVRVAKPAAYPRVVYRELLDRLSEVSIRRHRGESREAFARRIASDLPTFEAVTTLHVGAAFGSALARTQAAQLIQYHRAVCQERARAVPLWRRAIGALIPWSWLTSQ